MSGRMRPLCVWDTCVTKLHLEMLALDHNSGHDIKAVPPYVIMAVSSAEPIACSRALSDAGWCLGRRVRRVRPHRTDDTQ